MNAAQCRGCKARIRWIKTEAGKNAPVDPEKLQEWVTDTDEGQKGFWGEPRRITLIDAEGRTHTGWMASILTEGSRMIEGYVNHFASCPKYKEFRR